MFFCPHSCSFVFCDDIWGVAHSRKFAQARGDQNRSTITCVRRGVCFALCKIVFHSILDQNAPTHEAMKRKYAKEYSTAEKMSIKTLKWTIIERVEMFTSWQRQHVNYPARNVLSRSKKLYAGKFFIEWTLHLVEAKVSLLRLLSYSALWIKFEANILFDFIMTRFLVIMFLLQFRFKVIHLQVHSQQCASICYTSYIDSLQSLETRKAFSGQHCEVNICRLY